MAATEHVRLKGAVEGRAGEVLTPEAYELLDDRNGAQKKMTREMYEAATDWHTREPDLG